MCHKNPFLQNPPFSITSSVFSRTTLKANWYVKKNQYRQVALKSINI